MLPKASCSLDLAPRADGAVGPDTGFATGHHAPAAPRPDAARRVHWVSLNPVLQWSALRLCLPAQRLRVLMAPFVDVFNASNFELRCEAMRRGGQHAGLARLLHCELEQRHRSAIEQACGASTATELLALWEQARGTEAQRSACWAILADRQTSARLSLLVSREAETWPDDAVEAEQGRTVSMADATPGSSVSLRAQLTQQQRQLEHATLRRDRDAAELASLRTQVLAMEPSWALQASLLENAKAERERAESLSLALMLQAERRETAEIAAFSAESNAHRLGQEAEQLRYRMGELARELSAMEQQLQDAFLEGASGMPPLRNWICGRKLLYLGGRPGSNKAIRALVEQAGGEYRRHEGVVDDEGAAFLRDLDWADLVLAPLDACDRESAVATRRACLQRERVYVPLRTASIASFAAGLHATFGRATPSPPSHALCLRHG